MKPVPGICDRCGLRFKLSSLAEEYVIGKRTGKLVCRSCYDESHPQLDTRHVKTDDRQSVPNSRSDWGELEVSRALYGFDPVGHPTTSTVTVYVGQVKVKT
jgi:hypothetical protein